MRCKNCKKENKQIKAGKTRAGNPLYKCKHCGKRYTPNPKERRYSEEVRRQAILYMEGNSGRAVGRILGISKNTCLYWIRKYAKEIGEKNVSNERVKVIEMDELYTFSERKKQDLRDRECPKEREYDIIESMEEIKCPECGNKEIWKTGKPRGKQQSQCKKCRRRFITELNYDKEFKRRAIQIFYEGNSGRAVGKLMKINKSTVYNWIKSLNKEMEKSKLEVERETPKEEIEMDELYSYTKNKKTEHI